MTSIKAGMAAAFAIVSLSALPALANSGNWELDHVRAHSSTPILTINWECMYKKTGGKGENFGTYASLMIELPAHVTAHSSVKQSCADRHGQRRAGLKKT